MRELIINGLSWCAYHGRPIVSIRPVDAAWCFWLTLAPDDAEAMAGDREMTSRCASRAYQLVETLGHSLKAEIRETRLDVDTSASSPIVGTLIVDQLSSERHRVPITAVDAVIIAWRSLCPLRATDAAIEHIQGALGIERADAGDEGRRPDQLSTPVRQFIESLDFGGPEGPVAHP